MVLDGPVQAEPPEQRHFVQLTAKKRALDVPSKILLSGAEHLRELQAEGRGQVSGPQKPEDSTKFHIELLKLRQNWRLKKVGNSILGDLSYRTAGSHYKHSGVFEVSKADQEGASPTTLKLEKNNSALKVVVPSELEGIAYIQVRETATFSYNIGHKITSIYYIMIPVEVCCLNCYQSLPCPR